MDRSSSAPGAPCGGVACPTGFHCEYEACAPDETPLPVAASQPSDPLASNRFVFVLETERKRVVRIDSASLTVKAFAAGLAPIDLGVVGGRELTVVLDALNVLEVTDHRADPPQIAAWPTARALSHVKVSPTGEHAIAYFDWDDPRAQDRQLEPGNINQVSVLSLEQTETPISDLDPRLTNVAVGFLPRDVRFSADGTRAVVVGRDTLTTISLTPMALGVAMPAALIPFDGGATEILVDAQARYAVLRYLDSPRIDILDLDSGELRCLSAAENIGDVALSSRGDLLVLSGSGAAASFARVSLDAASVEPCATLPELVALEGVSLLAADPSGELAVAYTPQLANETIAVIDLATDTARSLVLEKAVLAVAFAGDGEHALLSHMKAPGTPAWDPMVEDPEVSVDKSYGVSWLNLETLAHRLQVNNQPFGPFSFVPPRDNEPGATFQAIADERAPELLRVSHHPGFDDTWIELAAKPLKMGYLSETRRTYVTQSHPWGRVTFVDPTGTELRHVTGFALEVE